MHTTLLLIHHVVAASTTSSDTKKKSGSFYPFLILLALGGVAYFAFVRPARNRQMAAVSARRQVEVGDEVTTTAGLIATVVAVTDDELTLEIAPGVHCRYVPAAILRVNGLEEPADETDDDASKHEVIDDAGESTTGEATEPTDTTDTTDGSAPA